MSVTGDGTTPAPAPDAVDTTVAGGWVSTFLDRSRYRTVVRARTHEFALDEPTAVGGTDTAPTPYEAILAALGACTAMTLRMYADRKGWPLESVRVDLRTARSHAADCEACETSEVGIQRVERQLVLDGALSDEQRQRLTQIADRCPVKQMLERGIRVVPASP